MMRRKGELSAAAIARRWPHQVMLRQEETGLAHYREILAFCAAASAAPRHHSILLEDLWHSVFCFSDASHARDFINLFGGEPFDPAWRGKGVNWAVPGAAARRR